MKIQNVTDDSFRKYGKVVKNIDFSGLISRIFSLIMPTIKKAAATVNVTAVLSFILVTQDLVTAIHLLYDVLHYLC